MIATARQQLLRQVQQVRLPLRCLRLQVRQRRVVQVRLRCLLRRVRRAQAVQVRVQVRRLLLRLLRLLHLHRLLLNL